ncbi:putative phage abortive infection protein [Actinobacillus equuli subsp. haemolyticus]|uniref:putative phage abortive infection protein n=1 Tax=Actinobacillus equuli TaxID=718 RepID=UPI00244664C5|nr:putative phage abortive infection protein [Actinobacillus equuli]WGE51278.1 putative phage abortive infection protein [Actinobacillus equuli subsp. haemolyticus]
MLDYFNKKIKFNCSIKKLTIGITIFAIVIFSSLVLYSFNKDFENLGPIGDYFGGLLNPILGFCSLFLLLYTINLQLKSIRIQAKELKLTRKELQATKEELARSAEAQENSSKILKQQQFESTFFALLNQIISSISKFNELHLIKNESKGMKANNRIINDISTIYETIWVFREGRKLDIIRTLEKAQEELNQSDQNLPSIFLLIYQTLKLIDQTYSNIEEAKKYTNMLRACLSIDILHLFAINGCRTDLDFSQYKSYIEKYELLEHMPFNFSITRQNSPMLIELTNLYDEKAFGKSEYYRRLKETK